MHNLHGWKFAAVCWNSAGNLEVPVGKLENFLPHLSF